MKGGFLYDRSLGSGIRSADTVPQIEAQARQALADMPEAEVTGVSLENDVLKVFVHINGQDEEIIVRRESAE